VSTFNLRGFADVNGNRKAFKFKPKDIPGYPLAIYVAGLRLGTQFDLGPLNFDFSYTIGMNSYTSAEYRTNSHVFKFFLGWLF
jgi:outer membrane protein assembly factor BamA